MINHYQLDSQCLPSNLDVVAIQVVPAAPFHPADGRRLPANHIYSPAGLPESEGDILKAWLERKDTIVKCEFFFLNLLTLKKYNNELARL